MGDWITMPSHLLPLCCWVKHPHCLSRLASSRAVVPNLFGARDWFCWRQFFHGLGWGMVWGWLKHITISVHFISIFVTLWSNYIAHHYAESVGALSLFSWAQVVIRVTGSDCKCRWSFAGSPNAHVLLCGLGIEDPCSGGSKSPCCPCFSHRTCFGEWHVSWCDIYHIWE